VKFILTCIFHLNILKVRSHFLMEVTLLKYDLLSDKHVLMFHS